MFNHIKKGSFNKTSISVGGYKNVKLLYIKSGRTKIIKLMWDHNT